MGASQPSGKLMAGRLQGHRPGAEDIFAEAIRVDVETPALRSARSSGRALASMQAGTMTLIDVASSSRWWGPGPGCERRTW